MKTSYSISVICKIVKLFQVILVNMELSVPTFLAFVCGKSL